MKLDQAKATFKMFKDLRSEVKVPIPMYILELNRVNKALFFLAKMKTSQCRDIMREFQTSDSHQ